MKTVIQRVLNSSVSIDTKNQRSIGYGLVLFVGFCKYDFEDDLNWTINKILKMRIFYSNDPSNPLSITEAKAEILVISQFTLLASLKKGKKPSWHKAASTEAAKILYNKFINKLSSDYDEKKIQRGYFGEKMNVHLNNDGPFTILLDSKIKS